MTQKVAFNGDGRGLLLFQSAVEHVSSPSSHPPAPRTALRLSGYVPNQPPEPYPVPREEDVRRSAA